MEPSDLPNLSDPLRALSPQTLKSSRPSTSWTSSQTRKTSMPWHLQTRKSWILKFLFLNLLNSLKPWHFQTLTAVFSYFIFSFSCAVVFLRANSPSSIPFCLSLTLFFACSLALSFSFCHLITLQPVLLFPILSNSLLWFPSLLLLRFSLSLRLAFSSLFTLIKPSLTAVFISFSRCSSFVLLSLVYCSFRFWRESREKPKRMHLFFKNADKLNKYFANLEKHGKLVKTITNTCCATDFHKVPRNVQCILSHLKCTLHFDTNYQSTLHFCETALHFHEATSHVWNSWSGVAWNLSKFKKIHKECEKKKQTKEQRTRFSGTVQPGRSFKRRRKTRRIQTTQCTIDQQPDQNINMIGHSTWNMGVLKLGFQASKTAFSGHPRNTSEKG